MGESVIENDPEYLQQQIQMLKKQNRDLRYSQRKQLLDKVLHENLQLSEEVARLRVIEQAYEGLKKSL